MAVTALVEIAGAAHYLAPVPGARAGVLLIPTIAGINPWARHEADALAAFGYTTLVWNPYPGTRDGLGHAEALERMESIPDATCLDQLGRAIDFLQNDRKLATVGAVGYCLGGRLTLLLGAHDARIAAHVAVYPSITGPEGAADVAVTGAQAIPSPVQLIYPGRDRVTSYEIFRAIEAALQQRSVETSVLLYPEAEHGFMHKPGVAVNDAATASARPQIGGFLAAHLGATGRV